MRTLKRRLESLEGRLPAAPLPDPLMELWDKVIMLHYAGEEIPAELWEQLLAAEAAAERADKPAPGRYSFLDALMHVYGD
ncbi:MAG: hypothetical protein ACRDHL_08945 [Candidatus Promineifilaceae bacterium]